MANGNNTTGLTSRQLVILCISLTVALNAPTFLVLTEHGNEMAELRASVLEKTEDRFHKRDHDTYVAGHEKLAAEQLKGIRFRFERNETQINFCKREIEKLKK
jgi:hypothetical protein